MQYTQIFWEAVIAATILCQNEQHSYVQLTGKTKKQTKNTKSSVCFLQVYRYIVIRSVFNSKCRTSRKKGGKAAPQKDSSAFLKQIRSFRQRYALKAESKGLLIDFHIEQGTVFRIRGEQKRIRTRDLCAHDKCAAVDVVSGDRCLLFVTDEPADHVQFLIQKSKLRHGKMIRTFKHARLHLAAGGFDGIQNLHGVFRLDDGIGRADKRPDRQSRQCAHRLIGHFTRAAHGHDAGEQPRKRRSNSKRSRAAHAVSHKADTVGIDLIIFY